MKVLIAVVTCKKYAHRRAAQMATWIPQMIAAKWDVQVFDGERLGVSDDYTQLPNKTKALCKWALDNGYDQMLKIDDDGYIWVDRFKVYSGDYCGIRVKANDGGNCQFGIPNYPRGHFPYDYCSGGSYWLSAKAMKIIAETPLNDDWAEDRWVGTVLAQHSIHITPTPDYGCHTFVPVLRSNFAVLAQIPDGGIDRLVRGLEPGINNPTPQIKPVPDQKPNQPPQTVGFHRRTGRPANPRVIRRPFGR